MNTNFKIGDSITWTLMSPMDTGLTFKDFTDFINNYTNIEVDDAFIKGDIIYYDELSTIVVEVKDMTQNMFPFTLFANEVKSRFTGIVLKDNDPYQRFLCLDTKSMTSLFYYDMGTGIMADAVYDADGNFVDFDIEDYIDEESMEPTFTEEEVHEQISIKLSMVDIEELENNDALLEADGIENVNSDGNITLSGEDACSITRAKTWFNTRDCAILTAWRQNKGRKENDDNNRILQQRLRELGYGVTKVTGWYPEENREVARENSFLTVNLNEEDSFRSNIYELSELYEQDSFLYKKAGRDIPAVLVHTNDDTGKGTEELAGRLRIGNMEADIYSQIKAGRITFE